MNRQASFDRITPSFYRPNTIGVFMAKNGFAYGAQSTANLTDTGMVPLSSESMIPKQAYATFDARNIQVDGGVVEDFISEKRIGKRIKDLRLKKSMGLVELG